MIRQVFIAVLFLGVCLELSQARSSLKAKIEDYADALIQGNNTSSSSIAIVTSYIIKLLNSILNSASILKNNYLY